MHLEILPIIIHLLVRNVTCISIAMIYCAIIWQWLLYNILEEFWNHNPGCLSRFRIFWNITVLAIFRAVTFESICSTSKSSTPSQISKRNGPIGNICFASDRCFLRFADSHSPRFSQFISKKNLSKTGALLKYIYIKRAEWRIFEYHYIRIRFFKLHCLQSFCSQQLLFKYVCP